MCLSAERMAQAMLGCFINRVRTLFSLRPRARVFLDRNVSIYPVGGFRAGSWRPGLRACGRNPAARRKKRTTARVKPFTRFLLK
jgi:hypothetical protein